MSEQNDMDELAYNSRMVDWAPLGKLILVLSLLIVGLVSDSMIVPIITFIIGLAMMAYSNNFRVPLILALAIGEAILIMILGSGMISIMGDHSAPALWSDKILWFDVYMTETSFNKAWIIFMRAIAGVTLMLSFACSTPIPYLAHAFRSIKCPDEITELIVLIYRYSFLLLERFLVMIDAAQCRLGYNGPMTAIKSYAGAMSGTFIFSLELADRSEAALACRNYTGKFPIFRMPRKMNVWWILISAGLFALLFFIGYETKGLIDMAELFAPWCGLSL